MSSGWFAAKTVIESSAVQEAADEAAYEFSRFEDTWEAIKWLLARSGAKISAYQNIDQGIEYHIYKSASSVDEVPEILVVYTIEERSVTIHGMRASGRETSLANVTEIHRGRKVN